MAIQIFMQIWSTQSRCFPIKLLVNYLYRISDRLNLNAYIHQYRRDNKYIL